MVQTEKVKLSQVCVNANNPRTITDEKLRLLVASILVLPKMLELRPIVVDSTMSALGGNMRLTALTRISCMTTSELFDTLQQEDDFTAKTESEQQIHLSWWGSWLQEPFCYIIRADELTEEEQAQFVVKDNVAFGAWNWQKLTKQFPAMKLQHWGMDGVPNFTGLNNPSNGQPFNDAQGDSFVEDGATGTEFLNLPPELSGVELEPDEHDDVKGEDRVEYQRVILTYKEEDKEKLCALLGIAELTKVVYSIEELLEL